MAAFAMVLQFVKTVWVEINRILFVLCSDTVTGVIADFLVIEIISQFDDFILLPVIKRRNQHLKVLEFSFKKFSESKLRIRDTFEVNAALLGPDSKLKETIEKFCELEGDEFSKGKQEFKITG